VEIIENAAGTQFDPAIVAVFLEIQHDLRQIAVRYQGDSETGLANESLGSLAFEEESVDCASTVAC
jgi:hypothetical protein